MSSFATYLNKVQELTQKNLDILNLLNDSLYSKQLHTDAIINDTRYSIPSFLYLENKLNDLEGNWKRLVNAPRTGNAAFVFDGNTQKIQMEGFENAPEPITVSDADKFFLEKNDIFKDFVSPLIYLKYDLSQLPDNINNVMVRKIAIYNENIFNAIKNDDITWSNVRTALELGTEDVDYVMYDKNYTLPTRHNDAYGKFNRIKSSIVEEDDTHITYKVQLDNIRYSYCNGDLERNLQVGDFLITDTDRCTLEIKSIDPLSNTLVVEVHSGYENINNTDYFKFWKKQEYKEQKYIKVPLEEDKYIVIFIAPINSTINVQATWGAGQAIDVDSLTDGEGHKFRDIYNSKIRNIGDVLFDLTKFTTKSLSNIPESTLKSMTSYKPNLGELGKDYSVVLLNDHLMDNSVVDFLRKLNVQKAQVNNELQTIQDNIDKINNILATNDFSSQDTVTRQDLEASLAEFNTKKSNSLNNLNNIINQITIASESSNLPTAKSKYVITGGIDYKSIENTFEQTGAKVIYFEMLYRYKNAKKDTSKATTVSDTVTVSDWNKYLVDSRQKIANFRDNEIVYEFEETNKDNTTGRWSTYQIPISQGETVDIFFRVRYDLGYPYVNLYSDWSEIVNVEFPEDLITDTDVENIINKNTGDLQNITIKQELSAGGITDHVGDKLIDQDQTYYHRPESIASGFYTEDSKRIISLKEKLFNLSNEIDNLKLGAFGSNFKDLSVIASYNNISYVVPANMAGEGTNITLPSLSEISSKGLGDETEPIKVSILLTLTNTNKKYPINIYSMFPGDNRSQLTLAGKSKFSPDDYNEAKIKIQKSGSIIEQDSLQRLNQAVYFRSKGLYDSTKYEYSSKLEGKNQIAIIPYIADITAIQMRSALPGDYIELKSGEAIAIPILITLAVSSDEKKKTFSFDVWDSPWQEPLTYTATIVIPSENSSMNNITESSDNNGYVATIPRSKS